MRERVRSAYKALSPNAQARFLLQIAFDITTGARDFYQHEVDDFAHLIAVNELQHRLISHAIHLIESSGIEYPDDVFLDIICDKYPATGLSGRIEGHLLALCEAYEELSVGNRDSE